MYIIKIKAEDFDKIKSKEKTWEVGVSFGALTEINLGSSILFKKEPELIEGVVAKVVDIKYFNTFNEMAKVLSIKAMGNAGMNATQVAEFYLKKFTPEMEKEHGVVAIKFEVL